MDILNNFKELFLSVWNKGIIGVDFIQILIGIGIFFIFLVFRGLISKLIIIIVKAILNFVVSGLIISVLNYQEVFTIY